ncbi:MAG: hypothetical protein FJY85_19970, partial [Deltaproteobacteria bacterium]|nr:hypothetical protein [Deltaproteobacteria bacterium]
MDLHDEVKRIMGRVRAGRLPDSATIVDTAFRELGYGYPPPQAAMVRREFDQRLHEAFRQTLLVLERFEEAAYVTRLPDELI